MRGCFAGVPWHSGEMIERVALVLPGGLVYCEEALHKAQPSATGAADREISPEHRAPQRPLGLIIGRLDLLAGKRPQRFRLALEIATEGRQ